MLASGWDYSVMWGLSFTETLGHVCLFSGECVLFQLRIPFFMGSGTPSVSRKLSWVMMSTAPTGATFIFMVTVTQHSGGTGLWRNDH